LLAREVGRGDEYMKYLEVFLHYYYSFPIVILNNIAGGGLFENKV
jgi:hypothetical protein